MRSGYEGVQGRVHFVVQGGDRVDEVAQRGIVRLLHDGTAFKVI
jgi:hypothetical protein